MFWKSKKENIDQLYNSPNPVANEVSRALSGFVDECKNLNINQQAIMKEARETNTPIEEIVHKHQAMLTSEIINKEKEQKIFIPKKGETYFRLDRDSDVEIITYFVLESNRCMRDVVEGNCYQTIIEAVTARVVFLERMEKMRKYLRKIK